MKFTLLILVSLLLSSVSAYGSVEGKLLKVIDRGEGDATIDSFKDVKVEYHFSNNEVLTSNTNSEGEYLIDPTELYCWKDCNIYPTIYLDRVEFYLSEILLSRSKEFLNSELPVDEQDYNKVTLLWMNSTTEVDTENSQISKINNNFFTNLSNLDKGYLLVLWNGSIYVPQTDLYMFFLNLTGELRVSIDNSLVFEDYNYVGDKLFNVSLVAGIHNITFEYSFYQDGTKPNLEWSSSSFERQTVPLKNLLFRNGGTQSFLERSSSLEGIKAVMSVVPRKIIYPNTDYILPPQGVAPSQRPVVLIHGGFGTSNNYNWDYWFNIPKDLRNLGHQVYQFSYYPGDSDTRILAYRLGLTINYILSYHSSLYDKRADVIGHSRGGLITLAYISDLSEDDYLNEVPYLNNIRRFVSIAAPLHGSHLANYVAEGQTPTLCDWIVMTFMAKNPNSPVYNDMAVGSQLVWNITKKGKNPSVDAYLAIAGITDDLSCLISDISYESEDSDTLVSATSASLLPLGAPLVLMDANHDNLRGDCHYYGPGSHPKCYCEGDWCWIGIGEAVWDTYHQSHLISGFLNGLSTPSLKSYLNNDVWATEYYIDPNDPYADSNYPYNEGTALIKISTPYNINNVKIKNINNEFLFSRNNQTEIYYHYNYGEGPFLSCIGNKFGKVNLSIADVICIAKIGLAIYTQTFDESLITCLNSNLVKFGINLVTQDVQQCLSKPVDYGLTLPSGKYDLYLNGFDTGKDVEVKPIQTTIYEYIDSDGDGTVDEEDSCLTIPGTYCHGCPQPTCAICNQSYCPALGQPYCINSLPTTQCGIDYLEYSCPWGNDIDDDTGKRLHDFHCDGIGSCLDDTQNWQVDEECTDYQYCYYDSLGNDDEDYYCKDVVTIDSPTNNSKYNTRYIYLAINSEKMMEKLEYSLDGARYRSLNLGKNKNQYFDEINVRKDGNHTLIIRITYPGEITITRTIPFFIDSTKPKIIKTKPTRGYANGTFSITYTEENCKSLALSISSPTHSLGGGWPCDSGKNLKRQIIQNLSSFDGEIISYAFNITDIANNSASKTVKNIKVDTTPPIITYFNYSLSGRYVTFNMTITEKNFDSVDYIDWKERSPRYRVLCSRLDKNNNCIKRQSFSKGFHNLTISAIDEAENKEMKNLDFNVSY